MVGSKNPQVFIHLFIYSSCPKSQNDLERRYLRPRHTVRFMHQETSKSAAF